MDGITNEKRIQNEEILAKSRREYKDNDPLETEAVKGSAKIGMMAGLCACFLFLTIDFFGTLFGFGRHDPAVNSIFYTILGGELIGRSVKSQKKTWQAGCMTLGILLSLGAVIELVTYLIEIYVRATGHPLFS